MNAKRVDCESETKGSPGGGISTERVMSELQEIIEGSFDGILVTDADANVLLVNQSYVRNTGIKKEELIGHNMRELINPVWMKNSVALIVAEQKQPASMHHATQNGKNIMVTGTPIFDKEGNIKKIVINSRDISEIYELREELSRAREMEKIYFRQIAEDESAADAGLVISDAKMQEIFSMARRISNFNTTVLISGESGVGKDVLAKYIHSESALRRDEPFVAVNCGAIPESLLESELFGYVEGAFTGAAKGGRPGLIEAANRGTLFLDEIGEMSVNLQVKFLRALEIRAVTRIGAQTQIPVDIRVIAATHRDLKSLVAEGRFREDLYYRLNVVSVEIPPLRERRDDVPVFTLKFLRLFNKQYGQNKKITFEVMKEMENHDWPGNVRQLKNVVENMVVVSCNEYLQLNDLPWIKDAQPAEARGDSSLRAQLAAAERRILQEAKRAYGSTRKMAEVLLVDQSTIVRKMKKLKL
ncbi:MAG: sigma 54-interacting transcriptional regulator [Clostridiales Family XIII bacterium]|jgi:PAS domain S-box-containing protein|nr:sigma 54-interacting transcriptional regulator [Clostridiales Family XIII bacterium]